ncbi:MAG: hypothetical protein WKF83_09890 [Nocardioidaceae bacterium]
MASADLRPGEKAPMDLLLPKGTRLLHIGPHKTGTTSLQGAFHNNRDRLAGPTACTTPARAANHARRRPP